MYCQKCRMPLKLDGSLAELNPAAFDLLVTSASQQQPQRERPSSSSTAAPLYPHENERRALFDKVAKKAGPATFKRHGSGRDNSSMSFVLLTESQVAPPRLTPPVEQEPPKNRRGSTSVAQRLDAEPHQAERINTLFEILSARSDIDHPVCVECTELLVEGLQKRLDAASRERDIYAVTLKQVQAEFPSKEDVAEAEKATQTARKEGEESMSELYSLEQAKRSLDTETATLEGESQDLDGDEEAFWRDRNAFATKLTSFLNERDSINIRYDHDSQLLTKLQRANVYNDTFSIHHDGNFATINGLRLGRLSTKPVEWSEINAAWGQALLLVTTVAEKLGYKFDGLEPLPMGSTSKIVEYVSRSPAASRIGHRGGPPPAPKKNVLELYASSSELPLQQLWNKKFEGAMVAFLELVRQLGAFVSRQTRADADDEHGTEPGALVLPYKIEHDKIGDERIGYYSIKLGFANEESWTKACKFALTCCKFLIAHTSNVSPIPNDR